MIIQVVEWAGEEYEVKYTFKFIQRLKREGINLGRIFRAIQLDPEGAGAYLDDYAAVTCECLREAGAPIDVDEVWREALVNPEFAKACAELFMWLVTQHYATSENAPKKTQAPKTPARKRKK